MTASPLISAPDAATALVRGALAIDCRFDLADTGKGEREYRAEHLPGAVYAHLDRDLSDLSVPGQGRHPLPSEQAFAATLARWGVERDTEVVAYDEGAGARAARLWFLLRMAGHNPVRVLDGGLAAWRAAGLPLDAAIPSRATRVRPLRFDRSLVLSHEQVAQMLAQAGGALLDARDAARFRGENETLDKVAGHVPGARSRPFVQNLGADGRFKPPQALRAEFEAVLAGVAPANAVAMCGSGVTACHNLLAMEHAGLTGARLYAASWSGWISDPSRPVAAGNS